MTASFEDGKDQGALRTIGELSEALGIKSHVLRYWEEQFPQLKPLKRGGGRRYYRPEDVALVREIDRLVNRDGYTLRGARTALKDFAAPAAASDLPGIGQQLDLAVETAAAPTESESTGQLPAEVAQRLRAIRQTLAAALAR